MENKWCIDDKNLTRLSRLFINELFPCLENDEVKKQTYLNSPLYLINGKFISKIFAVQLHLHDITLKIQGGV